MRIFYQQNQTLHINHNTKKNNITNTKIQRNREKLE